MSIGTESIITPDGHKRILNLEPSPPELVARVQGPPMAPIPLSEVKPFDLWPGIVKIKDQNGYGACNGHAAATAAEFSRAMAGHYVPLSAWWVYGRLVMGRDRGSNILQALELIGTEGIAPEPMVKYGDFSGRYSPEVVEAAKGFKVEIANKLTTWEEIFTAVAMRRGLNLAVRATSGWGRLDSNGCPPVGRGPANHAVMVGGGIKRLPNGELAIRMANSWSTQWGLDGFCWLTRAHIESASWFEAYETVASIDTGGVAA